jgi:hypothetical protein
MKDKARETEASRILYTLRSVALNLFDKVNVLVRYYRHRGRHRINGDIFAIYRSVGL